MDRQWPPTLVALVVVICLATSCATQPNSRPLVAGTPLQMPSPGKGTHDFLFQIPDERYQEIEVVQRGFDAVVRVFGPEKKLRYLRDSPIGGVGRELLCFIAEPGTWRVEITAFAPEEVGTYSITRFDRPIGDRERRRSEAFSLSVESEGKDPSKALEDSQRSYQLWERDGDLEQQALELWRQALLHNRLGQSDALIETYLRVAEMLEKLHQKSLLATVHHNLGTAYYGRGELEWAIEYYLLALAGRTRKDLDRAATLAALGKVYIYAGSWDQAHPFLEQSRLIYMNRGSSDRLARIHADLGWMCHGEGRYDEALDQYRQALDLAEASSAETEAYVRNFEAGTRLALGEPKQALAILESAAARLPKDSGSRPRLEVRMVEALIGLKRFEEAEARIDALFDFFREMPVELTHLHFTMAQIQRGLNRPTRALSHMKRLKDIMAGLNSDPLPHGLRALYEARRISYAELYLDLLIETSSDRARPDAFRYAEGFRAGKLATSLASLDYAPGAENPDLAAHLAQLRVKITAAAMTFSIQIPGQEIDVETELNDLLRRYDSAISELLPKNKNTPDQMEALSIEQIQRKILDDDTGLLFFAMGSERVHAWAIDRQTAIYNDLGARRELEGDALDLYDALRDADSQANQARIKRLAQRLSDPLTPVLDQLAGHRRLLIVADGALHYLPFAPLMETGGASLVTNHEIVYSPSCSVLDYLEQRHRQRQLGEGIAILAAPSYGDEFQPLPHAKAEASAIAATATDPVLLREGSGADKTLVLSGTLNKMRYLHFACHGLFMERRPELSALVLTTRGGQGSAIDGMLYLHEIEGLHLEAELVVLSACETALGREVRGEGLVGLPHSFFKAGCSGVLVSLWPVHDAATTELMTHFYKALYERGASPPEALRQAQAVLRESEKWHAPYYWAGFIYQGIW